MEERTVDTVVFSGGSHPGPRDVQRCQDLPRAGGSRASGKESELNSSRVDTLSMVARWSERETQIVMVDMVGCLLAIDNLAPRFPGPYYTLFDSEHAGN